MSAYPEDEQELEQLKIGDDLLVKRAYFKRKEISVAFIMNRFSCEPQIAEEIYVEAFSRFYIAVKKEKLAAPLRASLQTYLNTVGKNLYLDKFTKANKFIKNERPTDEFPIVGEEAWMNKKHDADANAELVGKLLDAIDEKCKKLLEMAFLRGFDRKAIAENLGIKNLGTLRKRIFGCLEKLRKLTKRPEFKAYHD